MWDVSFPCHVSWTHVSLVPLVSLGVRPSTLSQPIFQGRNRCTIFNRYEATEGWAKPIDYLLGGSPACPSCLDPHWNLIFLYTQLYSSCSYVSGLYLLTLTFTSFSVFLLLLLLSRFSRVWLCATPWTAAHQAPLSTGFSKQEYWSGLLHPQLYLRPISCQSTACVLVPVVWHSLLGTVPVSSKVPHFCHPSYPWKTPLFPKTADITHQLLLSPFFSVLWSYLFSTRKWALWGQDVSTFSPKNPRCQAQGRHSINIIKHKNG